MPACAVSAVRKRNDRSVTREVVCASASPRCEPISSGGTIRRVQRSVCERSTGSLQSDAHTSTPNRSSAYTAWPSRPVASSCRRMRTVPPPAGSCATCAATRRGRGVVAVPARCPAWGEAPRPPVALGRPDREGARRIRSVVQHGGGAGEAHACVELRTVGELRSPVQDAGRGVGELDQQAHTRGTQVCRGVVVAVYRSSFARVAGASSPFRRRGARRPTGSR